MLLADEDSLLLCEEKVLDADEEPMAALEAMLITISEEDDNATLNEDTSEDKERLGNDDGLTVGVLLKTSSLAVPEMNCVLVAVTSSVRVAAANTVLVVGLMTMKLQGSKTFGPWGP